MTSNIICLSDVFDYSAFLEEESTTETTTETTTVAGPVTTTENIPTTDGWPFYPLIMRDNYFLDKVSQISPGIIFQ